MSTFGKPVVVQDGDMLCRCKQQCFGVSNTYPWRADGTRTRRHTCKACRRCIVTIEQSRSSYQAMLQELKSLRQALGI